MRVLVIEDEIKMAAFIKRGLEEEGIAVDIAADGEEGLFRAKVGSYDLIILDITLPLLDGLEVCRRLRQDRATTPILLLTARDSVEMKVRVRRIACANARTAPPRPSRNQYAIANRRPRA
jgi:DNA-binding response OmpR family regulator